MKICDQCNADASADFPSVQVIPDYVHCVVETGSDQTEEKDDDGAKGECHGKDAKITTSRWLPTSNGNTDTISDSEKHLRYRDEEEDEYEKPDRSLVVGTHVVGAIDDEEIKEKENGWE
jgi:hypothetical protein